MPLDFQKMNEKAAFNEFAEATVVNVPHSVAVAKQVYAVKRIPARQFGPFYC